MKRNVVNLDALIPRADFQAGLDGPNQLTGPDEKITIHHLRSSGFFAGFMRKPDFQRETIHWTPQKVVDLVRAFVDRDLIPAVILWRAGQFNFVIDGSHRLSALLAWIYDDYGDRARSLEFFGNDIPPEQKQMALKTRDLIEEQIGHFSEYEAAINNPTRVPNHLTQRVSNLSIANIIAQWVPAVDAEAAANAFFKINDSATPIDPTERRILKSRRSASAIAARAITHGGKGHRYWGKFAPEVSGEIEGLAESLYRALYEPPLGDGAQKTLDVPIAGRGYSALPFVFDFVNMANDVHVVDSTRTQRADDKKLQEDADGAQTLAYLKKVQSIVHRITGTDPASLGLHPVVYFYNRGGNFSPWAFLAIVRVMTKIIDGRKIPGFLKVRNNFEDFLLDNKNVITTIVHKNGSGSRSVPWLEKYFDHALELLKAGTSVSDVNEAIARKPGFAFLLTEFSAHRLPGEKNTGRFSKSTKTAAMWEAALPGAPRCAECGGLLHRNSIQIDHAEKRASGGAADVSNARVVHPYCNSIRG